MAKVSLPRAKCNLSSNDYSVITLLRVLIDKDSPASYKVLFQSVFKLVSDVCEEPTRFHYLHGIGIKSIVIDMCPKQMTGKMLQNSLSSCDG
jgi:hypothetical protein